MSKQVPRVSDKIVSLPSTNKRKASPSEKEDIVEDIVDSDFTDDEQGSRDSKGDKSVNKKTKTTPKLRTVPAEPPQELPKPTHNKPIANVSNALVKSGPSEVLQPEWKKGVHKSYADNPQYFRNINLADIRLIFQEPYKGSHQAERITPVLKGTYNEWLKKDKKKQAETNPMPKRGNYGMTDDYKNLGQCKFTCLLREGQLPEDLVRQFPAIYEEIAAYLDFKEALEARLLRLYWEAKPDLRNNEREIYRKMLETAISPEEVENRMNSDGLDDILYKNWVKKTNSNQKYTLVQQHIDENNPDMSYRWTVIKKNIARVVPPNDDKMIQVMRQRCTGDPNHYIDQLAAMNKMYNPPYIKRPNGEILVGGDKKFLNDVDYIKPGDIVSVVESPKVYALDSGAIGTGTSLVSVTLVRPHQPGDGYDFSTIDVSDLTTPDIDDEITKRIQESEAANAIQKNAEDQNRHKKITTEQQLERIQISQALEQANYEFD